MEIGEIEKGVPRITDKYKELVDVIRILKPDESFVVSAEDKVELYGIKNKLDRARKLLRDHYPETRDRKYFSYIFEGDLVIRVWRTI